MSWLKRERVRVLNLIQDLLKQRGELSEEEVIRTVMCETMLSRQTVKRYVDDLVFIGWLERNSDKVRLKKAT